MKQPKYLAKLWVWYDKKNCVYRVSMTKPRKKTNVTVFVFEAR